MAECSESAVSSAVMEDGRKLGYEHLRHRMLMVSSLQVAATHTVATSQIHQLSKYMQHWRVHTVFVAGETAVRLDKWHT